MMADEEDFILKSQEKRKIMIDTQNAFGFCQHIERLSSRIIKLAISTSKDRLKIIRRALYAGCSLGKGQIYFTPDMEEGKTWLVSDFNNCYRNSIMPRYTVPSKSLSPQQDIKKLPCDFIYRVTASFSSIQATMLRLSIINIIAIGSEHQ